MSATGIEKATIKIQGKDKKYLISEREIANETLGKLTVRNILKDIGAVAGHPGEVTVRLMGDEDPSQDLEITGDEILVLAEECIRSGGWSTGIGPVARVALASPAAKEGAASRSAVSNASLRGDYCSPWRVCLRWTSEMREMVMRLPAACHADKGMSELMDSDMDTMFIIKQHVTALEDATAKVCRPAAVHKWCCRVSRTNSLQ